MLIVFGAGLELDSFAVQLGGNVSGFSVLADGGRVAVASNTTAVKPAAHFAAQYGAVFLHLRIVERKDFLRRIVAIEGSHRQPHAEHVHADAAAVVFAVAAIVVRT